MTDTPNYGSISGYFGAMFVVSGSVFADHISERKRHLCDISRGIGHSASYHARISNNVK